MPGLAVYATPENMQKFKASENQPKSVGQKFSSPYAKRVSLSLIADKRVMSNLYTKIKLVKPCAALKWLNVCCSNLKVPKH